jgi:hypothetical protein
MCVPSEGGPLSPVPRLAVKGRAERAPFTGRALDAKWVGPIPDSETRREAGRLCLSSG